MSRSVLSAIVSCFFAAFVNGSLEVVQNSSQSEDHQLTGTRLLSDQIGIIGNGGTKVNNDIVSLLLQSMNISTTSTASPDFGNNRQLQRQLRRLPWNDDNIDESMTDGTGTGTIADNANDDITSPVSIFSSDEIGWSNINEQVDMVTPMVLAHLQKLGLEHLHLPDMRESLSVKPLFITYSAELLLNNGLVYHLTGIERTGDALMTYSDKSFVCRFYLLIKYLQFDYDFLIKLMAFEGYGGKVYGSLDDTVIYADLYINVEDTRLRLNDFRIIKFRNIQVQLSQRRFIQELSGVILSPITNLFRDRITTSISDGLKDQMQGVMDDFNNKDPLELRTFAKQMLAGLMGQR